VCHYTDVNTVDTWTYSCVDGRWDGESTCEPTLGGGCPVPPLVERCDEPFVGQRDGANVELGPAGSGPFVPFAPGAPAPIVWGGQGSPMLQFRLNATGVDDLSCVRVHTTTTVNQSAFPPKSTDIELHCGESMDIFSILELPCDPGEHSINVMVEVEGVGTAEMSFTVVDPACVG
jgi:hypothetical protein